MRPLIVCSVLKLLYLHCGGRRVSGPRQYACASPSCLQRQVLLGRLLLPVRRYIFGPSWSRRGSRSLVVPIAAGDFPSLLLIT